VVLLGDIFDFWFDYPHFVMKSYEPLLAALDRVRAAGSRLHFVGGNHDIWAAEYFHRRYGTARDAGPVTLELDGQRVRCIHGDGVLGRDVLYKAFRSVVRHPAGVWLGKAIHPELLFAFSTWLSGTSRHSTRDEMAGIEAKAARWLQRQRNPAWDQVIMGHVHHAFELADGPRRMAALAGWLGTLGYGLLREGRFRLLDFDTDPDPLS
jgi:UDP-2,3-diacylglucosamine hydrolase